MGSDRTLTTPAATPLAELWRDWRIRGDRAARDRLALHYAPLVKFVAARIHSRLPSHVDLADLVGDGMLGLLDAIDRYHPDRSVSFESYASFRIRGAILDAQRRFDWAPRTVRSRTRAIERATAALAQRLGRHPTTAEIAAELGVSAAELRSWRDEVRHTVGTHVVSRIDGRELHVEPSDPTADPAATVLWRARAATVRAALTQLPAREAAVLHRYYFTGMTMAAIGAELGVTESRVCQIHAKALRSLRALLTTVESD